MKNAKFLPATHVPLWVAWSPAGWFMDQDPATTNGRWAILDDARRTDAEIRAEVRVAPVIGWRLEMNHNSDAWREVEPLTPSGPLPLRSVFDHVAFTPEAAQEAVIAALREKRDQSIRRAAGHHLTRQNATLPDEQ